MKLSGFEQIEPSVRAFILIVIAIAYPAFGFGFDIGAFERLFFEKIFVAWSISTALLVVLLLVLFALLPSALTGQEPPPGPVEEPTSETDQASGALRVFLDCSTYCDRTFFRTEIVFVNWVRNREDSDVHVIVTDQDTGGGGEEFIFQFIGRGRLSGRESELRFLAGSTDTRDEIRSGQTRVLGIGLANYSAMLGRVEGISVQAAESFRSGAGDVGAVASPDVEWRRPVTTSLGLFRSPWYVLGVGIALVAAAVLSARPASTNSSSPAPCPSESLTSLSESTSAMITATAKSAAPMRPRLPTIATLVISMSAPRNL